MNDDVNKPKHYTSHPSNVECIDIVEHMDFCLGNAIKYIWRSGLKTEDPLKDLEKAKWYIEREIKRLRKAACDELARESERLGFYSSPSTVPPPNVVGETEANQRAPSLRTYPSYPKSYWANIKEHKE